MGVYVFNIFSVIIYAIIISIANNRYKKSINRVENYEWIYSLIFSFLIVVQLFLLSTLKNEQIGYDTVNYINRFSQFSDMSFIQLISHEWETGYTLFNKFISLLGFNYNGFSLIMYSFFYVTIFIFLKDESEIPWLSLFLFIAFDYLAFSLSVYRQFFAIVINLLSIKYIRKQKPLKFVFTILVASLFHQSAIVFLIIYPISHMRLSRKFYLFASFVGVILILFGGRVINFLLNIYNRKQTVIAGGGYNYFLMLLFITIFGIFLYYRFGKDVNIKLYQDTELYIKIMITATILQIFSFHISIFVRVVYYFSFYIIIYIPNLLKFIPSGHRRNVTFLGICMVGFILFLYFLNTDVNGIYPYQFFWQ